jgi:hypothetical protein
MDISISIAITFLATTPARWESLAQALPIDRLLERPATGEWSALDCLQHLLDSEVVFLSRVEAFRQSRDFPNFDPEKEGTHLSQAPSSLEMTARFASLRRQSLEALRAMTPADFTRRVRHSELGPVSLAEMAQEWAAHDLDHTMQAEKAVMQPFILACGPWQAYYESHLVK